MPFSSKATTRAQKSCAPTSWEPERVVAPSIANMYVEEEEQEVVDAILGLLRGLSVTSGIDASDIRLRYTSRSLSGTGALRFDLLAAL
ncbi:hypothetical protein KCV03_g297, partial [Aureobasidium melanogenum]